MQPIEPQPLAYLMRRHRDLFVDPLFWTSRHLDLVGCHFDPLKPTEHTEDNDMRQAQNTNNACKRSDIGCELLGPPAPPSDPERLAKSCAPLVKLSALYRILEYEGSAFEERW